MLCLAIAAGPIAAPFVLWPVMALAGCEPAGIEALKCVHAEWLSGLASAVMHLPWLVFFSAPVALVAFFVVPPITSAILKAEIGAVLPGLVLRLIAVAAVAVILVVTFLSLHTG